MKSIAAMAAAIALGAASIGSTEHSRDWPKPPREPEPKPDAGKPAGSKWLNRKKRGKQLFRV